MTTKHHHHGTPPLPALSDQSLITHLRDAIAEARRRKSLHAELRHLLADELSELKAEVLVASGLTAEQIAELSGLFHGTGECPPAARPAPVQQSLRAVSAKELWEKHDAGACNALTPRDVIASNIIPLRRGQT